MARGAESGVKATYTLTCAFYDYATERERQKKGAYFTGIGDEF